MLHEILPRVLAQLCGNGQQQPVAAMDDLLHDVDLHDGRGDEEQDDADKEVWEKMLLDLATGDQSLSPAEVNRKRKQLTFAAFQDPLMVSKALSLEALVQPNVHAMHTLFKRSAAISKLQMLPTPLASDVAKEEAAQLKQVRLGLKVWRQ